jgi:uncharacterized protein (DUF58 family)
VASSLLRRVFGTKRPPEPARAAADDLFDEEFLRRLESLALASRRAAAGLRRGDRRMKKKGSGIEFADHKAYVPGDDIRLLDVGVYQRLGKLLLRIYEEEEDLSLYFLIDRSASMAHGAKLTQAVRLTAALGYIGLSSLDRVSVLALGSELHERLPPIRGKQRLFRLLRFLSGLRASGRTDLSAALRRFASMHQRRGLAVLLTDLYDPRGFEAGIDVLVHHRFEVCVLHIGSTLDRRPTARGDVSLIDAETAERAEITLTAKKLREVEEQVEKTELLVRRFCARKRVAYFNIDAGAPFDEVVLYLLRRGGLLE